MLYTFRTLILFAALLSTTTVVSAQEIRTQALPVVDGEAATVDEIFSTVAILMLDEEGNEAIHCTGSLLAPDVVLTASHCIQLVDDQTNQLERTLGPDDLVVVAGALHVEESEEDQYFDIEEVLFHDSFPAMAENNDPDGLGQDFDIALLLLTEPVETLPTVPILPPSRVDEVLTAGTSVIIAGYGGQGPAEDSDAGELFIAETPFQRRGAYEFIAGQPGNPDTCPGDSGGPLYVEDEGELYVVGASARGVTSTDKTCGDGGIYTLVPAYLDWIAERVEIEDAPDSGGLEPDSEGLEPDAGEPEPSFEPEPDVDDGGCQTAPGPSYPLPWIALFALLWLAVSRRTARRN